MIESPHRIFGTRDLPYLKPGIRDFKAKLWRDSGLKVCAGGGMTGLPSGLPEVLGRDYGIEELYCGPKQ